MSESSNTNQIQQQSSSSTSSTTTNIMNLSPFTSTKKPKRKFNREFQKNEVIKFLIMKDQNFFYIEKPIAVPQSCFVLLMVKSVIFVLFIK